MTDTQFLAVLSARSALLGALIGGAAAAASTWLQQRAETRRELVRLAAQIEADQLRLCVESPVPVEIGDSSLAIVSHYRLLRALADHGPDSAQVRDLLRTPPIRTST